MSDDEARQICTGVLAMAGRMQFLEDVVSRLPKTSDGVPVLVGMTVYCPNGHPYEVRAFDPMGGRIYCTKGGCWDSGCQNDSGSGTHYNAKDCSSKLVAEAEA